MKKIRSSAVAKSALLLLIGVFTGWLFFRTPHNEDMHSHPSSEAENSVWTCSMHPQIKMNKPGKCPICGMDLIPLVQSKSDSGTMAIKLTPEAVQLANVMVSRVNRGNPVMDIRLYGKVVSDERMIQSQTAHIPGRIEKLLVSYTGELVKRGQVLAILYSPELITAQQELIEASKIKSDQPAIYEAAKERLRHWKLTEEQIMEIEKSERPEHDFEVVSTTTGNITSRMINTGDHVTEGTVLFEVADLSKVWIIFDAYENDLPFLKTGNKVQFFIKALPGRNFEGTVTFIDPVMDPVTRVARVRAEYDNFSGLLKPEMFVTGIVKTQLGTYQNQIVVPKSAVLWTGTRSIVYVKEPDEEAAFSLREVTLGPSTENSYVITAGLQEGEEIVTNGTFSIDAAAQLEGKPSMMNH